jgi:predicted kinase
MLAPILEPAPGAVVLRSDVMRKKLFDRTETEKLPAEAYSAEVNARIYAALADQARRVITAGHSAIVDAVFSKPAEREALAALARTAATRFRGVFLTADLATRTARVGARVHDASDADAELARRQEGYDLGTIDWVMVDASGTPEQTLARVKAALA